jgi:hypothetical protein
MLHHFEVVTPTEVRKIPCRFNDNSEVFELGWVKDQFL